MNCNIVALQGKICSKYEEEQGDRSDIGMNKKSNMQKFTIKYVNKCSYNDLLFLKQKTINFYPFIFPYSFHLCLCFFLNAS